MIWPSIKAMCVGGAYYHTNCEIRYIAMQLRDTGKLKSCCRGARFTTAIGWRRRRWRVQWKLYWTGTGQMHLSKIHSVVPKMWWNIISVSASRVHWKICKNERQCCSSGQTLLHLLRIFATEGEREASLCKAGRFAGSLEVSLTTPQIRQGSRLAGTLVEVWEIC